MIGSGNYLMKSYQADIQELRSKAFNLPALHNSRLPWVDYLKGIAIVLVVYRHALNGIGRSGLPIDTTLGYANMIFYSFRMPLFFILSGLFISGTLAKRSVKTVLLDKFETLFYPYLIWSFIQVTLQIVFWQFANSDRGWEDYTYILYQPRKLDQFWYLPALFNATLVYVLVKVKFKPRAWAQLLLGLLLYFASRYLRNYSMLSDWMEFYLFFAMGDAMYRLFFKPSTQRFLKNPWTLLAVLPVFTIVQVLYLQREENYYRDTLWGEALFLGIALVGCFSMFVLAFRMQSWNIMRFLRVLGYHSLYIYLMHVLVMGAVRVTLTKLFNITNVPILLFCCIAAGVVIPVIIYNLLIKDGIGWFLFTFRKKKKIVPSQLVHRPQTISNNDGQ